MSAPTRNPTKPTDDPLFAVIEPALKVGAFAGKIDPDAPGKCHQEWYLTLNMAFRYRNRIGALYHL